MRNFLLLITFSLTVATSLMAQSSEIKLEKDALEAFTISSNMDFQFNARDVEKLRPETMKVKPATMETISEIRARFNGDAFNNGKVAQEMGQIFSRMFASDSSYFYFSKAIDFYKNAMEAEAANPKLYAALGECYTQVRKMAAAAKMLHITLELDSTDSTARTLLPTLYLMTGDFGSALVTIKKGLEIDPTSVRELSLLSSVKLLEFFSQSRAEPFGTPSDHYKKLPVDSIIDLKEIKKLSEENPKNTDLQLLYQLGRQMAVFSKAYFTFSVKERRFGLNDNDHKVIADLQRYYKKALKERPRKNKFILYHGYAFTCMLENDFEAAVPWLRKAIKSQDGNKSASAANVGQVYDNIASAYLLAGDTTKAEQVILEKVKVRPGLDRIPTDITRLARFEARKGNLEKVVSYCEEALTINPNHLDSHLGLSYVSFMRKDYKTAEDHINQALKLDDTNLEAGMMFAFILYANEDVGTSQYLFERLLELNPNDEFLKKVVHTYFKS